MEDMASRIERMESLLATSGLNTTTAIGPEEESPTAEIQDKLSMLLVHDDGASAFIGNVERSPS